MQEREREGASLLRMGGNALPGEVGAGLPASGRRRQLAGCRGGGRAGLGHVSAREGPRGRPGGLGELPRVHLAADAPWTKSTGGVQESGSETER